MIVLERVFQHVNVSANLMPLPHPQRVPDEALTR